MSGLIQKNTHTILLTPKHRGLLIFYNRLVSLPIISLLSNQNELSLVKIYQVILSPYLQKLKEMLEIFI